MNSEIILSEKYLDHNSDDTELFIGQSEKKYDFASS